MSSQPYQVLARKYRPQTFTDLLGQETLVQVLKNGLEQDRLPHAFILTGVRGVGKTTTARLLARCLNCVGADGQGGPTVSPCGQCEPCRAIAEDRHLDVMEMDAASRTGVEDIRDITEGTRYKPVSGRYKVYIIDEVHMLTKHAFNALLKTLEEPPAHVKFIFATTEIKRVPDTVLSRCIRFDLKRLDAPLIATLLKKVLGKEGVTFEEDAISLLARAADGSARDSLSLLDQAISLSPGQVRTEAVRQMLGLMDRTPLLHVFDALLNGQAQEACVLWQKAYQAGLQPLSFLQELLDLVHQTSLYHVKALPEDMLEPVLSAYLKDFKDPLDVAVLSRLWQLLVRGMEEIQYLPMAHQGVDMVLIRAAHVALLPTPQALIEAYLQDNARGEKISVVSTPEAAPLSAPAPETPCPTLASFEDLVRFVGAQKELLLQAHLMRDMRLVRYEEGLVEAEALPEAPKDLAARLQTFLAKTTGKSWSVVLSANRGGGTETLHAQHQHQKQNIQQELLTSDPVKAVMEAFPDAEVIHMEDDPLFQTQGAV